MQRLELNSNTVSDAPGLSEEVSMGGLGDRPLRENLRAPTVANQQPLDDYEEINLLALWRIVWRSKYIVTAIMTVFVAGAVAVAFIETPIFRAEAVFTEVQTEPMNGLARLGAEFGGLAGLAGMAMGPGAGAGGGDESGLGQEAEAVLRSHYLIRQFIERNNLVPVLLPHPKKPATLWMAVRKFHDKILSISDDKLMGTTTVAVEWKDPVIAAQWANGIVALANNLVRTRAMDEDQRNIAYLDGQVTHTNDVMLRTALYSLIEDQTKQLMLAEGRKEYAFTVVDPAVPPEIRAKPIRTLIVLMGGILGGMLAFVVAFVIDKVRRQRAASVRRSTASLGSLTQQPDR
jgi:Chain length determinant protein/G-rich domain on putative tyrosine kinase